MSNFQPEFSASIAAVRVLFGPGYRSRAADEVRRLGCGRALVLSTPEQHQMALDLAETLGEHVASVFTGAAMHTPVSVTGEAMKHVEESGADCLVAIGGGSTTGLGKAIALRTDLPQVVLPTTYAGSEATPILGQTERGKKTTLSDPKVQPEVIIYDPELVRSLPVDMTVASALNAMAHAAEALYAVERHPISTALAIEGLQAFRDSLPSVVASPDDLDARGETLYGAWLCGTVLGQVGMALHHKLCHTLGGSFNMPHAETHAILLPHAIAYNARAVPDLLRPVCDIFGRDNAGLALHDFARQAGAPLALSALGLQEGDLDRAAELATEKPYPNPRPVERDAVRGMLQAAWAGEAPAA